MLSQRIRRRYYPTLAVKLTYSEKQFFSRWCKPFRGMVRADRYVRTDPNYRKAALYVKIYRSMSYESVTAQYKNPRIKYELYWILTPIPSYFFLVSLRVFVVKQGLVFCDFNYISLFCKTELFYPL